jgi:hypothetical protein
MTAEPPGRPVAEEVRSLEVRWIFPGPLETTVAGWFGRFLAESQSREDTYLVDPRLRGLSVKVRGDAALEVKVWVWCCATSRAASPASSPTRPCRSMASTRAGTWVEAIKASSAAAPKTS